MNLHLSDFDYDLPSELIALHPVARRPAARLMVCDRRAGNLKHHTFGDIKHFLKKGDLLVLNDTKVLPARLLGRRETGGQAEALLLEDLERGSWEALLRPSGRIRKGSMICFGENGTRLVAKVLDDPRPDSGMRKILFEEADLAAKLDAVGHIPLPPYIERPDTAQDAIDYQTVYAKHAGAIASPTAGLHFDRELLRELEQHGVEIAYITLHVSYGSFQPVQAEDLNEHVMVRENFCVSRQTVEAVERVRKNGCRVIACGTTSVRALESASDGEGRLSPKKGSTDLFIYPSYKFKAVDAMITNFHLPKSTLLMLVSAFFGKENLVRAYEEAVKEKYRFYSYGDAMLII